MKWLLELLEENPMECYIIVCLAAVGLILMSLPREEVDQDCLSSDCPYVLENY